MLRHSAAVHMAEEGVPISEISQYLGHSNTQITERIYARYSPEYLRKAAAALEYDDLGSMNQRTTTQTRAKPLNLLVGATGIEPVTPTMSR